MDNIVKPGKVQESWRWVIKMAWQDSRKNRARLFIFILSIALGIGALVGINSFKVTLVDEINDQAKELLGADIAISGQMKNFQNSTYGSTDTFSSVSSMEISFASMVFFPRTDGTRLVNVKALVGDYPYYGKFETSPTAADSIFRTGQYALVDESVMLQYDVEVGDQVKVGEVLFEIAGKLQKVPGQTAVFTSVAPIVYIPMKYFQETKLLQKGSRIQRTDYYQLTGEATPAGLKQKYEADLDRKSVV